MPKYDFDSYLLYEIKRRNVFPVKIRVMLKEPIKGDILEQSAPKAFKRFPYYSRDLAVENEAYILRPCDKPLKVFQGDRVIKLGSVEANGFFFAIAYEGNDIFFNFSHNFCGACGAMRWIKATLWQYLTDAGYDIDKMGILTLDTPITPDEVAEPDVSSLPTDEPVGDLSVPRDSYLPIKEYMARMQDPNGKDLYYPVRIPKKEFMKYVRNNDGSPNSVLCAILFKTHIKALPEEKRFTAGIANNYRADVGCPNTYRDMIRSMYVSYDLSMKDWSIEKLSTLTRSRMYLQMQPEVSWEYARKVERVRNEIDAQPTLDSKTKYAVEHTLTGAVPSAFHVSYVGKVEWGGLAPFIDGIYTLTVAHLLIEVNATENDFCFSFQTYRKDNKYIKEFTEVLEEEGIAYSVGEVQDRKLPQIILP